MSKFEIGDIVCLKGQDVQLVVLAVEKEGFQRDGIDFPVLVAWHVEGGALHQKWVDTRALIVSY